MDGNWIYCGYYFIIIFHKNIKSLCCKSETNIIILYINYNWIKILKYKINWKKKMTTRLSSPTGKVEVIGFRTVPVEGWGLSLSLFLSPPSSLKKVRCYSKCILLHWTFRKYHGGVVRSLKGSSKSIYLYLIAVLCISNSKLEITQISNNREITKVFLEERSFSMSRIS